jgi:hypothetical protein
MTEKLVTLGALGRTAQLLAPRLLPTAVGNYGDVLVSGGDPESGGVGGTAWVPLIELVGLVDNMPIPQAQIFHFEAGELLVEVSLDYALPVVTVSVDMTRFVESLPEFARAWPSKVLDLVVSGGATVNWSHPLAMLGSPAALSGATNEPLEEQTLGISLGAGTMIWSMATFPADTEFSPATDARGDLLILLANIQTGGT